MGFEIEHKWLPEKELTDRIIKAVEPVTIEQAYLCREPVIRVRREGSKYYMTYKGDGLLVREEANLPLTENAFTELAAKCDGNRIVKERYTIPYQAIYPNVPCSQKGPHGDLLLELDVFHGKPEGLVILEIEFATEEDALSFAAPSGFGRNVTDDPNYTNAVLSK